MNRNFSILIACCVVIWLLLLALVPRGGTQPVPDMYKSARYLVTYGKVGDSTGAVNWVTTKPPEVKMLSFRIEEEGGRRREVWTATNHALSWERMQAGK